MARNPRGDQPGSWHHVLNRGIARRSVFESRDDIRFFLSCLARAVRRGQIEVHAWCILTTHFHLLVKSPIGELSDAMRRVQLRYVRRFNRGRRRDGPLVRGRFRSKPVTTLSYRKALVHYIDQNAVVARLARSPEGYEFGSARAYARGSGPPWLTRGWVEGLVVERLGLERFEGTLYSHAFRAGNEQAVNDLVERRLALPNRVADADELDHLINAAPARVLAWLHRKARLADATLPGLPVTGPARVRGTIDVQRERLGDWTVKPGRRPRSGWQLIEAGLLRDMAGATYTEIGARLGCNEVTAARFCREHHGMVESDDRYAEVATGLVGELLSGLAEEYRVPYRDRLQHQVSESS